MNTALITGGGSELGLALAEALMARGAGVVLADANDRLLDKAMRRVPNAVTWRCDVGDRRDRDRLVEEIRSSHPGFDTLVNAAAVKRDHHEVASLTVDDHTGSDIETNLTSAVDLSLRLLPLLLLRPQAFIVNVIPSQGFAPDPRAPVHAAAKAGLHMFSRSLRSKLRGTNVRVVDLVRRPDGIPGSGDRNRERPAATDIVAWLLEALVEGRDEVDMGGLGA